MGMVDSNVVTQAYANPGQSVVDNAAQYFANSPLRATADQAVNDITATVDKLAYQWALARELAQRKWETEQLAKIQQFGGVPPGSVPMPMDFVAPRSNMPFSASPFPIPIRRRGRQRRLRATRLRERGLSSWPGRRSWLLVQRQRPYGQLGRAAGAYYYTAPAWATSPLTWGAVAGIGAGGYTYHQTGDARTSLESGLQVAVLPTLITPELASSDLAGLYSQGNIQSTLSALWSDESSGLSIPSLGGNAPSVAGWPYRMTLDDVSSLAPISDAELLGARHRLRPGQVSLASTGASMFMDPLSTEPYQA